MGRDLSQLFLLIRRQIILCVFGVAPHQINTSPNYNVNIDNPGAAALASAFGSPTQLSRSARSLNNRPGIRITGKVNGEFLNPVHSNQVDGLDLEFWELQDRYFGLIIHSFQYTAMRYNSTPTQPHLRRMHRGKPT
jgi:hypothetical protein